MTRSPWHVAALLTVSILAGCIGGGPASSQADGDDHEHAPGDVMEVRIPEGAWDEDHAGVWFDIDAALFEAPTILRFINDDTVFHRAIGEFTSTGDQQPAWVDAHGHSDDHGHGEGAAGGHKGHGGDGHEHAGAGDDTLAFDVSLEPGEQEDVHVDRSGLIAVHCHPHPWMVDEWDALSEQAGSYDVAVHRLVLAGSTEGDLRMGHDGDNEAALDLSMNTPNMVSLQAILEWDDEEDDGSVGESANEPDAFRLALVDPQGSVVAEDTLEARSGKLQVKFTPEGLVWPDTVEGQSMTDATQRLNETHPDDGSHMGSWTIQVELLHAPGYLSPDVDDGGTFHDAPEGQGFDGHQTWTLSVMSIHEWVTIDTEPTEMLGELHFGEEGAGHAH